MGTQKSHSGSLKIPYPDQKGLVAYSEEVRTFFEGHLEQVFLYITNRCGLRCKQCFYKGELGNQDMPLVVALVHSEECWNLGARKITLLGGEPSLYNPASKWRELGKLLKALESFGYNEVRLDTNGQFASEFLYFLRDHHLTELSFSLDGGTEQINDQLRGEGSFTTAISRIREAVDILPVSVTICVSRYNFETLVDDIQFLQQLGVKSFNFHPLLKVGNQQDFHILDSHLPPEVWSSTYRYLAAYSTEHPDIKWRIPPRFAELTTEDDRSYCSIKKRDRLHIQPNGQLRICPLSVGGPFKTCQLDHDGVIVPSKSQAEIDMIADDRVCGFQRHADRAGERLCVSLKPPILDGLKGTVRK